MTFRPDQVRKGVNGRRELPPGPFPPAKQLYPNMAKAPLSTYVNNGCKEVTEAQFQAAIVAECERAGEDSNMQGQLDSIEYLASLADACIIEGKYYISEDYLADFKGY